MEYAICFPLQLFITLAVIQLAYIFVAKQVVEYGAFCGARAKLVGLSDDDARRAVIIPISAIARSNDEATEEDQIEIPGWGPLKNSAAAEANTTVTCGVNPHGSEPAVVCEVEHKYLLSVPIAGTTIAMLCSAANPDDFETPETNPLWKVRGRCILARPWGE